MASEPEPAAERSETVDRPAKARSKVVKPGHMPVSEVAFDRPGAGSPFGDDIEFPVPPERLTYEHPTDGHPESQ
jgi:succinate dehydrogenase / fumarate reductase iron-sulfur subunit